MKLESIHLSVCLSFFRLVDWLSLGIFGFFLGQNGVRFDGWGGRDFGLDGREESGVREVIGWWKEMGDSFGC